MSSPLILDFACPSDEDFEQAIDGFSEDAKKGYRRERKRVLRERKEAAIAEEKRAVQHGRPITQGQQPPPKPSPKKPLNLSEEVIVDAVGRLVGEVERDLADRIDELAKERRDALDDIHRDYQNVKNDIDHAVHSKIADALRLERQKRAQIELRLERALDDIEKLKQQVDGAGLYEVGRTE
ncbi:hypothetical protein GOD34_18375 [Sinorhizobium medicae]|uniref:hypothetical protein n=1 Tax=Sinorhizobium medicae TaxID=110321 RepID=UPI000FDAB666|nr:hypothetical protein [Sinorhizobium medicae]MDX0438929.1 hypothetical protein [Sinorhizobium medicae]MDX0652733.1 hypothetical protein [Sinorhizobium medicae]MDX1156593.1 hypothetical protein [Sinorhizobium medicae]RVJ03266.1 hypothetical protein CN181_25435 [Sinorhizobium medicae]